jgi:hypothetical protein
MNHELDLTNEEVYVTALVEAEALGPSYVAALNEQRTRQLERKKK